LNGNLIVTRVNKNVWKIYCFKNDSFTFKVSRS
jgi:hypothetical protein